MKKIFAFLVVVFSFLAITVSVSAQCGGQYQSPCQSYSMLVDKMVGKPGASNDAGSYEYVDNLSVNDPRFKPDQTVFFKIKIKNTSTTKLVGMEVRDTVPSYLEPLEGPGTYNSTTREIVWNAGDFNIDEQKTYYLKMKVSPQANLPADKGLFCISNFVKANSANAYDDDRSQLCIEKQVVGAVKVPSAGPELGLILLSGEILALATGMFISYKLKIKK